MQGSQPPELLAYKALQAVQRGNAEELAKLIQAGANAHVINAVVKTGTSPNGRPDREAKGGLLYHAVEKENVELVKVLLSNGAEVNGSKQDESPPPLRAAVMKKNVELVTLLLKRGANVNRKYTIASESGKLTTTVLFETTSDAVYGLLLRRGGDVNTKDSRGDSPLHVHTGKWNASFVNRLVEHGADVDALDTENRTPLVRAIEQWDFPPGGDEEEEFIYVCHTLMSHKAKPPLAGWINKPEHAEQLLCRLQLMKEWETQRSVGMIVLTHVPVEIYRRGVAAMAAFFVSNTLVPVPVEQSEIRTEALLAAPRRQTKTGMGAWTGGEEVLQRKVEILPALDRSPSSRVHAPSSDDISLFPGRQDPDPIIPDLRTRTSSTSWVLREEGVRVDQLPALGESQPIHDPSPVLIAISAEKPADLVESVEFVSSFSGPETALCVKSSIVEALDPISKPTAIACEAPVGPVLSDAKPALPSLSPRSPSPPISPLQLYRLKIVCATGLRRALKYRRQSPYCVCRLIRGDGEILVQFQTAVHPGGGQVPTWRGQVFEMALTKENTHRCTLVFVLKHSGLMASLDERIAVGMMPFPHLTIGHTLTHKLLLMNNDKFAGGLEVQLEAY